MDVNQFVVIVHSPRPGPLTDFYQDVVGLTPRFEVTPGAFAAGSSSFVSLIIEPHDRVTGPSTEPERVLLNFVVDDIMSEQQRLKARGVSFVRDAAHEPGVGLFATFTDIDGNYCQLIEFREQAAATPG